MMESFPKQPRIKGLPSFSIYRNLRLKETDLNEVVRTVEGMLPQYMHGNIGVKIALSEKNLKIMADKALMQEALINLVKNAMDAMPGGGIFSLNTSQVNFENRSVPEGSNDNYGMCAFISFADTGIGIDEMNSEMVFGPFFTTKIGHGRGLGLPIACHIIKEHGGTMKVESRPGHGTAINVYLPLAWPEIVNMIPIPLPAPSGGNLFNNNL
jgi:signal transduction histidine kinase